jgi:hypothetical protein
VLRVLRLSPLRKGVRISRLLVIASLISMEFESFTISLLHPMQLSAAILKSLGPVAVRAGTLPISILNEDRDSLAFIILLSHVCHASNRLSFPHR